MTSEFLESLNSSWTSSLDKNKILNTAQTYTQCTHVPIRTFPTCDSPFYRTILYTICFLKLKVNAHRQRNPVHHEPQLIVCLYENYNKYQRTDYNHDTTMLMMVISIGSNELRNTKPKPIIAGIFVWMHFTKKCSKFGSSESKLKS